MPNLDRIAQEDGTFSPLMPTNPPQTPVSWSAFATGLNPGRTEIFDFLQREKGAYQPDFALVTREKKTLLFGERNGLYVAGALGLAAGLFLLLVLKALRRGWALAGGAALVVAVAATAALAGPIGRLLPVEMPAGTNNRKGTPFWTIAAQKGMKVRITHVPVTFPAETLPSGSTMISGLGVPDMRGRVGTPYFFTSDPNFTTGRNNEFSLQDVRLPARRGKVETTIAGPYNYPFHQYVLERATDRWKAEGLSAAERAEKKKQLEQQLEDKGVHQRIDLPLRLELRDDGVAWDVSGQQGTLAPGEWSDWVVLDFPVNPLVDFLRPLRGMARFKLIQVAPEVQLYLSPINFHPSCHPVAYSFPDDWALTLSKQIGLFKTIGWTIDTWSYPSGVGGIDLFLEDMWATVAQSDKIMERSLTEPGADIVVQIYDFTDRAGHMLWHELDDAHPLFKPELAPRYRKAMEDTYRKMDEVIGRAHDLAGPDALFVVLSDHGFSSFRRQINYNTWLYRQGLLVLKGQVVTRDLEQLFDRDVSGVDVFRGIDWSATRAWSMGLGSIYVNVVGREPNGIVMPGPEYDDVVRKIQTGLEAEVDPITGLKPVHRIYRRDELYHGFDANKIPDMRASNIEHYRVSWQDTLGGLSTQVFEDNDRVWSGDHCSLDPQYVRGILLVNRRLRVADPGVMDIAPSILNELNLSPAETPDGRIAWEPKR
jgi:predicted AlkP superfamily phosphohydrolase/phosphomutase